MATEGEQREIQARFRERTLALCGNEFAAVTKCRPGSTCDAEKQTLLSCMQTKVCEILHEKLLECTAAKQDCAGMVTNLNRCLAFAYSSLPPPPR
eukprot:3216844-Prymnesium_polylepis.2